MSYDKIIGFCIDPEKPKGPMASLTSQEFEYFHRMGVKPIFHDLKKLMGGDNKEPEPKILLPAKRSFKQIRNLISESQNAFFIPGQMYQDKNPLTSVLIDTVHKGIPTALLDKSNYTLRYRFESNPVTGTFTQGDFNEKSGLKGGQMIGGCIDRFERELEQRPGESLEHAYNAFLEKYRHRDDAAFCDGNAFGDYHVAAGYQAARNEMGFAVKHPQHDVLFVFEACEDVWHCLHSDMKTVSMKLYEFEFEPKQIWGELPPQAMSKAGFKHFLYQAMTQIRDSIHACTHGSTINMKSKAEIAKEHLDAFYGVSATSLPLSTIFDKGTATGYHSGYNAFQYSLLAGGTLEDTLTSAGKAMHDNGARLHHEKSRFNVDAPQPDSQSIGFGSRVLELNMNDNRPAIPVATYN